MWVTGRLPVLSVSQKPPWPSEVRPGLPRCLRSWATTAQAVPFQCSSVTPGGPLPVPGLTATVSSTHTWRADRATMPSGTQGWPSTGLSLGRASVCQDEPFQCTATVICLGLFTVAAEGPSAQMSVVAGALTDTGVAGTVTGCQALPSKCSTQAGP